MTTFKCITHDVRLTIEGKKRTIIGPKGSYPGIPHCYLLLEPSPTEGKHRDCQVVKES